MGTLIFSCPTTWRPTETGIETDATTIAKVKAHSLSIDCPHCHATHQVKIKDCHLFKRRPRQSQVHCPGLLRDEVDVGSHIQRTLRTR